MLGPRDAWGEGQGSGADLEPVAHRAVMAWGDVWVQDVEPTSWLCETRQVTQAL